ncbi:MAG: glycogen synthase GlgA [Candidatus Methylomirabilales bacterium]
MRIVSAASEMTPFAKTGGLADVAGALPAVLAGRGHRVTAFLPKYGAIDAEKYALARRPEGIEVPLGDRTEAACLWETHSEGVRVILIDHERFYDREGLYQEHGEDYPDNAERFIFFSRGMLEAVRVLNWKPDVIHCHDWQSSLIPAYLKTVYGRDLFFADIASVLTIHNLGYQGLFPADVFPLTGLPDPLFTLDGMEFWGRVNFLKAGLVCADLLSTVSRTYSQEIQTAEFGCGLQDLPRRRAADLYGVLNGVDYHEWNPRADPYLVAAYSADDLTGKAACKVDIQEIMGLPTRAELPLVGVISRLVDQKGIDLIAGVGEDLLRLDLQMVLLGTGDVKLERRLQELQRKFPTKLAVRIGLDVAMSHKIEAGADIFLMPSRYEPCGLTQMYSLAYGTIPVVRDTGGLGDTITPFDPAARTGNGFTFRQAGTEDLLQAVREALTLFHRKELWKCLMQNAMACHFSWEHAAREYEWLYGLARGRALSRRDDR